MFIRLSFLLLITNVNLLYTQNLVRNSSFEDYTRCPQNIVQDAKKFPLKYWNIPSKGTTDYFNACSHKIGVASVPKNQVGYQEARTGLGYIAIGYVGVKYAEYIQAELIYPLIKDEEYYLEFWVSLADYSVYKLTSLGAYFSADQILIKTSEILNLKPQIVSKKSICDTENWMKISGVFVAKGEEKYITIGSFIANKDFILKTNRKEFPKEKAAYYYIDDVLVERVRKDTIANKQFVSELNKPIILENITFEFGKSELKESSFAELNELAATLKENPTYQITLSGHTDNVGQEEDNLKLSEARAKAVAEYLTSKGIAPTRISYQGYGSRNPITTNETEQGREQNRRVEFILTQDEK